MTTKNKSLISGLGHTLMSMYVTIGLGVMTAFAFHLLGLGRTLIPEFAWNTFVLLIAIAVAVAAGKRDLRGIALGSLIVLSTLFCLGIVQATEPANTDKHALEQTITGLSNLISTMFPIMGGLVAISFPFLYPRRKTQ